MALVKKKVLEIISVVKQETATSVYRLVAGGDIIFPYQKMVALRRINRGMVNNVLIGSFVGISNNGFILLDVNGVPLQPVSPTVLPVGFVASSPAIGIDDADSEISFHPPVMCGGVRIEDFVVYGGAAFVGSINTFTFSFEIEMEVMVEEFGV